ncbi:MAG: hypothetical protein UV06_C0002G0104 [Candidatus Collierbacteria bacterium GW2011_GWA2_42_17]|uniref:Methyltransferase type 12 domain-containing protein n=1 Tax=Candidatus Collierbacteria bacterium GW2011_GWA2_42_17 TaxID=1618378 RepID=A0A0G0Z386_9BACT|nr:MAG: hypothetical protein UU94_C0017G0005 [Candidatus Collierbacteria bacterium GW2011_GWB2_42_12]KKS43202.1 MAG: hypothetical protein UV06_C0002G0104 [Candidatus Collierbacteria bacterium GW2011_GWA2_42_17]HAS69169.1 hypothetical protein [Candidatus Collierbacteria bacterium]HBX64034.1 hypothetical protein [Candidatus Collierbacteria bacterium]
MPQEENIITSVKNIYDNIGKEFSSSRQYIWPDLKPYLKNVKSGSSVLDVGCGNGRLLLGLPEKTKYTGLDISKELLKEAERAHPEHKFYETDITKESLWKHLPQYDYIFCIAVFHHLPTKKDQLFVLNQIKRHLKPRGKILITAWNLWQPKYLKYHFDLKTKLQNPHFVYIPFQGKPRFCFAMTTPYLKKLLESVNLKLKVKKSPHNYILN